MPFAELQRVFSKGALPAVAVCLSLAGGAWVIVGAASHFSTMVDERAQTVVEKYAAPARVEAKEFREHFERNDRDIAALLQAAQQQDRNITRLMAIIEEEQRTAARSGR